VIISRAVTFSWSVPLSQEVSMFNRKVAGSSKYFILIVIIYSIFIIVHGMIKLGLVLIPSPLIEPDSHLHSIGPPFNKQIVMKFLFNPENSPWRCVEYNPPASCQYAHGLIMFSGIRRSRANQTSYVTIKACSFLLLCIDC